MSDHGHSPGSSGSFEISPYVIAIALIGLGIYFINTHPGFLKAIFCSGEVSPPLPKHQTLQVLVTAYDTCTEASVGKWAYAPEPRVTATGTSIYQPGIAAAFSLFPPGTQITLPAPLGTLTVDDTGGRLKEDAQKDIPHLDLRIAPDPHAPDPSAACQAANSLANQFGIRWMQADVYRP